MLVPLPLQRSYQTSTGTVAPSGAMEQLLSHDQRGRFEKMPPSAIGCSSYLLKDNEIQGKERIKCVLVGDGGVGKTSLVVSYSTNGFPNEYVPTAFDNYNVLVSVDGHPVTVQLCDTAGQDDFDPLRSLCYPETDVFLLCFSVVNPASFRNIREKWLSEVRSHCPDANFVLIGTQNDKRSDSLVLQELARYDQRPVSEENARELAKRIGAASYIETSALTQRDLKEAFDQAIVCGLAHKGTILKNYSRHFRHKKVYKKKEPLWKRLCCFS